MSAKRILFLATDVFARGGIQRYARYQVQALRELYGEGNVYVLSLLAPAPDGFEDPIKVDGLGRDRLDALTKLGFIYQALRLAYRHRVDLVICNHISLTPIALLIKRLLGIPYCMNAYGVEIWSGPNQREILGMVNADLIISDCHFTQNILIREHGRSPDQVLVLEDCVDTTKFRPKLVKAKLYEQFGIPRQPKVILTIGRLSRKEQYKGHDRVMQALQTYCRDMDVCYLIVGDGDDRPRLEALAEDLGLEEWCRFPGFVADELLVDIYNLCDVFILVSEFGKGKGEGIPLVLLEASACGKPVIAGKYDGSAEAVEDGVTGYMVDSLNLQEIAQAIRSVLEDNEKAREMGLAGRRRIEELFSYEVFRDKLGRHLERLG